MSIASTFSIKVESEFFRIFASIITVEVEKSSMFRGKLIASAFGTALEGKIFSKFRKKKNPSGREEQSFQS
jgi:hypothetical protein